MTPNPTVAPKICSAWEIAWREEHKMTLLTRSFHLSGLQNRRIEGAEQQMPESQECKSIRPTSPRLHSQSSDLPSYNPEVNPPDFVASKQESDDCDTLAINDGIGQLTHVRGIHITRFSSAVLPATNRAHLTFDHFQQHLYHCRDQYVYTGQKGCQHPCVQHESTA